MVTSQRFEIAVKHSLRTGFGARVRSLWKKLSPEAGALVLYCALRDESVNLRSRSAGGAVKALVARQKAHTLSVNIQAAAEEASGSGSDSLVSSEAASVELSDDACRPHLRALGWTEFGITERELSG
jgi:hypothetical protein